jgi:uncharacterized protein (DUF2147 family)
MRALILLTGTIIAMNAASAAEPTGDWRVADGSAVIRIDKCNGALWGIVAWEKAPARDAQNPNPALRDRPTLGMPILLNMKETSPSRWEGQIYNPQNGKTYSANLRFNGDNALQLEGCVLGGIFCGGQQWTRAASPAPQTTGRGRAPASDVCASVANLPGRPH